MNEPDAFLPILLTAPLACCPEMEARDVYKSRAYWAAYRPAYRVVARDFLEGA